jgi:ketosteroid isomerase-like protein
MRMQAAVKLVRRIIEALNRGDVDGMLARMHPDFEWRPLEASPVARVYRGREQVRRYVEDRLTTFDVVRLDLEDPTELADRVVAMVRGRGRGRASGVELDTRFCQVWTVRCGMAVGIGGVRHSPGSARQAALGAALTWTRREWGRTPRRPCPEAQSAALAVTVVTAASRATGSCLQAHTRRPALDDDQQQRTAAVLLVDDCGCGTDPDRVPGCPPASRPWRDWRRRSQRSRCRTRLSHKRPARPLDRF